MGPDPREKPFKDSDFLEDWPLICMASLTHSLLLHKGTLEAPQLLWPLLVTMVVSSGLGLGGKDLEEVWEKEEASWSICGSFSSTG